MPCRDTGSTSYTRAAAPGAGVETLPGTTGRRHLLRPGLARCRRSRCHLAPPSRRMTDARTAGDAAAAGARPVHGQQHRGAARAGFSEEAGLARLGSAGPCAADGVRCPGAGHSHGVRGNKREVPQPRACAREPPALTAPGGSAPRVTVQAPPARGAAAAGPCPYPCPCPCPSAAALAATPERSRWCSSASGTAGPGR